MAVLIHLTEAELTDCTKFRRGGGGRVYPTALCVMFSFAIDSSISDFHILYFFFYVYLLLYVYFYMSYIFLLLRVIFDR